MWVLGLEPGSCTRTVPLPTGLSLCTESRPCPAPLARMCGPLPRPRAGSALHTRLLFSPSPPSWRPTTPPPLLTYWFVFLFCFVGGLCFAFWHSALHTIWLSAALATTSTILLLGGEPGHVAKGWSICLDSPQCAQGPGSDPQLQDPETSAIKCPSPVAVYTPIS